MSTANGLAAVASTKWRDASSNVARCVIDPAPSSHDLSTSTLSGLTATVRKRVDEIGWIASEMAGPDFLPSATRVGVPPPVTVHHDSSSLAPLRTATTKSPLGIAATSTSSKGPLPAPPPPFCVDGTAA